MQSTEHLRLQALPRRRGLSQCLLHDIATRERSVSRERAILGAVGFFPNDIQFQHLPGCGNANLQGISNMVGNSLSLACIAESAE